ncbi:methyltransferase domain-containing protein [Flaviflexus ciconiae]|uniref:Methyltransferase domain-containing protein n=1 Tax=Flaviflexus ciconiae TaxID=2496867 RepID=A0A3Q9G6C9_9ACTO|nr:methyltransferase [Flaviflexus ciconiae]AZQ76198.1 methyltransferase domain-containing protein [Flaviflexus ciconiae]
MSDHYFSSQPTGPEKRRDYSFTIRGDRFDIVSDSGVFSHDRLDKGTQILLKYVVDPPQEGLFVDVGCGWGPIALALATAAPNATVLAVDVNERARTLTEENAKRAGLTNIIVATPDEGLALAAERGIDAIWSNPPVRIGKQELHQLLLSWFEHLDGYADLVIGKNLGADSLHAWLENQSYEVERIGSSGSFRVLEIIDPRRQSRSG